MKRLLFLFLVLFMTAAFPGCTNESIEEDPEMEMDPGEMDDDDDDNNDDDDDEETEISLVLSAPSNIGFYNATFMVEMSNFEDKGIEEVGLVFGEKSDPQEFNNALKYNEVSASFEIEYTDFYENREYVIKPYAKSSESTYYGNTLSFITNKINNYLPSYWKRDGEMRGEIFYDDQNRITEILTYSSYSQGYWDASFRVDSYSPSGMKKSTFDSDGGVTQTNYYYYQDGVLDSIDNRSGGDLNYVKYFYSPEQECALDSFHYVWRDDPPRNTSYSYSGDNCSNESSGGWTQDFKYTYDDKIAFMPYREYFERGKLHAFTHHSNHNLTEYVVMKKFDGSIFNSNSYTSEFTYNEKNYPITETRTYFDGDVVKYRFFYREQ